MSDAVGHSGGDEDPREDIQYHLEVGDDVADAVRLPGNSGRVAKVIDAETLHTGLSVDL